MLSLLSSLERLRIQERCVNSTKSARRSVSTSLAEEGLLFMSKVYYLLKFLNNRERLGVLGIGKILTKARFILK